MRQVMWGVGLVATLVLAGSARAEDEEAPKKGPPTSAEEVTTGEIRLMLNSEYVKVRVDGNEWEEHEFMDGGRTLVIHTVNRMQPHQITLTPVGTDLAPADVTCAPEDWKLVQIAKNEKMWRVERKVVLVKAGSKPKEEPTRKTEKPAPAGK